MAAAGLGSRRGIEKLIGDGQVLINNQPAILGQNADAGDTVVFNGQKFKVVQRTNEHRSLIYNKPEGQITTRSDPQGRPTVFDQLPALHQGRWIAVGRLDINTSGLLLLTTDGELAHAMMHPSNQVDREYACRIRGVATPEHIQNLLGGVELDDGPARFTDIQDAGGSDGNHWYHVVILEGRNREVRRLWKSQGLEVSRLKRVRYGAVFLPKRLHMGKFSEISPKDHRVLREDVGLEGDDTSLALNPMRGKGTAARRSRDSRHGKSAHGPARGPVRNPASGSRKKKTGRRGPSRGGKRR
jgi:23S rRNA pseudouridine2605 synthase